MNIPKKLRIGPFDYEVMKVDKNFSDAERGLDIEDSLGRCYFVDRVILVRSDLESQKAAEVLLHEIIHAITDNGAFRVLIADEKIEEALVNELGCSILNVMRQNPGLFASIESAANTRTMHIKQKTSGSDRGARPRASA